MRFLQYDNLKRSQNYINNIIIIYSYNGLFKGMKISYFLAELKLYYNFTKCTYVLTKSFLMEVCIKIK